MVKETTHRETWKGGTNWFVIRDNKGRMLAKRKQAGSGLTKRTATSIFKKNRTLYANKTRTHLGRRTKANFYANTTITKIKLENNYDFKHINLNKEQKKELRKRIKENPSSVSAEEKAKLIDIIPLHLRKTPPKPRGKKAQLILSARLGNGSNKRYYGRSVAKGSEVGGIKYSKVNQLQELCWENLQSAIASDSEGHNSGDTIFGREMIETYGLYDVRWEWTHFTK